MTIFEFQARKLIDEISLYGISAGMIHKNCNLSKPAICDFIQERGDTGWKNVSIIRKTVDQIIAKKLMNFVKGN